MVDFGGGRSSFCDRGKTKSTPSPFDLDWNGLGLEFDNNLKHIQYTFLIMKSSVNHSSVVYYFCPILELGSGLAILNESLTLGFLEGNAF